MPRGMLDTTSEQFFSTKMQHTSAINISDYRKTKRAFKEIGIDFIAKYPTKLVVCVAAAERRGIQRDINLADGFEIAGLGQLVEAAENCDRMVTF